MFYIFIINISNLRLVLIEDPQKQFVLKINDIGFTQNSIKLAKCYHSTLLKKKIFIVNKMIINIKIKYKNLLK